MSCICTLGRLGAIFAICGTLLLISLSSAIFSGAPASREIASMCKIVFELPPIAISTTIALRIDFSLIMLRILNLSSRAISQIRLAAFLKSASLSGVRAKIVPFPLSAIPMASHSVFIEFAVNIPLQLPPPGHAAHSINLSSFSSIFLVSYAPTASKTEFKSRASPLLPIPAFIGPPLTKMVGTFTLKAPISIPGTILSQFGMQIRASSA